MRCFQLEKRNSIGDVSFSLLSGICGCAGFWPCSNDGGLQLKHDEIECRTLTVPSCLRQVYFYIPWESGMLICRWGSWYSAVVRITVYLVRTMWTVNIVLCTATESVKGYVDIPHKLHNIGCTEREFHCIHTHKKKECYLCLQIPC